ncbi:anthranilate phosphoribosyltransferase [Spiromyces aspiralis]|uniref:Anthranilate phosphoribosyltransferase n=1 Tax=Spiromyces aspiralis TaxID=68401 RepID=A0ACC1HVQ4_9FUNG|nr:anthranilate phosphoribosyltransferase [Spiromyces aspiralis]
MTEPGNSSNRDSAKRSRERAHLRQILQSLILDPNGFTPEHAAEGLRSIMNGEASESQMGGFLTALRIRGVDRSPDMIASLAREMLVHALVPELDVEDIVGAAAGGKRRADVILADIVGTGGDGWNTFNVSTTAGLIAAGAGLYITKHGSRASSSNCGSADLLERKGCRLMNISPSDVSMLLQECRYCFLFSQLFHPAMAYLAKTRRELGFPTPFNVLGPLTNPARPDVAVIGVHSQYLGPVMAEALHQLGARNYAVVCGEENLDEISIAGRTNVWHIRENGNIDVYSIHPSDFGLPTHPLQNAAGSTLDKNCEILDHLLDNTDLNDNEKCIRDFVLINAAFLIYVAKKAETYKEAVALARESLESGRAKQVLESFARMTEILKTESDARSARS